MMKLPRFQPGFTLLELTVALLILIALAGVVLPFTQGTVEQAACQATDATLMAVKEAIMGSGAGPGYYSDMGNHLPQYRIDDNGDGKIDDKDAHIYHLHFLFNVSTTGDVVPSPGINPSPCPNNRKGYLYPCTLKDFNPNLALGWRGPYLQSGGGKLADPARLDASFSDTTHYVSFDHKATTFKDDLYVFDHYRWRNPIVLQVPTKSLDCPEHPGTNDGDWCARLVSAGPDGAISTTLANVSATDRGDDRVLFLRIPDPLPQGNQPCVSK